MSNNKVEATFHPISDLLHEDDRTKGKRLTDKWFPIAFWLGVAGTFVALMLLQAFAVENWGYWLGTVWATAFSVGLGGLITEGLIDSYIDRLGRRIKELENEGNV